MIPGIYAFSDSRPMAIANAIRNTVMAVAPEFHRLPFSPGTDAPDTLIAYVLSLVIISYSAKCVNLFCTTDICIITDKRAVLSFSVRGWL